MNGLFLYLLKVLICSGILFGYYWVALRDKKFHQYNRFYLLFSVVFSLVVPIVHLSWFTLGDRAADNSIVRVLYAGDLDEVVVGAQQTDWTSIGIYAIVGVSALLLLLLAVRVVNVLRLAKKYPAVKLEGVDFLDTDMASAPFSFLNYLFWKHNINVQSRVGQQILEHELTHIRQKHTWDKLFMQIVAAILWFNPFYWLTQRELSMIHEFLADEKAIGDHDVQSFAEMLLEAHYGKQILQPVNPFAYRPIRRRLKMLANSSRPSYSYLRRLFFLPLLVVVTGLFAFTVKKQDWKMPQININEMAKSVGIDLKSDDSTTAVKAKTLPDSLIIIHDDKKRDTVPNVSPAKLRLVQNSENTDSLSPQGKVTSIRIRGVRGNEIFDGKGEPLFILDGMLLDAETDPLKTINPTEIESMSVLKGPSATALYGDKGKDGVILITTKKGHKGSASGNNDKTVKEDVRLVSASPHQHTSDSSGLEDVVVVGYGTQQKEEPNPKVDKEASYPGGTNAWKTFLTRNLRADIPTENGAPAGRNYTVIASFIVDKEGNVSEVRAVNDPGYGTAQEVIRLIKRSGKWEPAIQKGKKVIYRQRQQVTFQVTEEPVKKKK
ncbi:MAG: M56 family metallopeptidase [Chitinophagaceae bacterium]